MIIALVGMTGSGKSTVAEILKRKYGFPVVRFGDVTDDILRQRGLEQNEKNERMIREELRKKYGMEAYAKLSKPRMDEALKERGVVVVDGLYSWEEYLYLKGEYGDELILIHVFASPKTRYKRVSERDVRPLTEEEARERDRSEIENLHKGGPIAMADFVLINEGSLEELEKGLEDILQKLSLKKE